MTLQIQDRVKETSVTTGTGALTLAGAMTGFRAFSSVCTVADTCYYGLQQVDANGVPTGAWEVGLGTYSAASVLTRTTILASSNAGAAVSLAAGTTQVWIDLPAAQIAGLVTGSLLAVRTLTAGAYTQTAGTNSAIFEIQGAGGAGGGAPATNGVQISAAGGGGSGGYIKHYTTSLTGLTAVIGAAGIGVSGAGGSAGGATSIAGLTAGGGGGALAGGLAAIANGATGGGGAGGTASGGSILNIPGSPGGGTLWLANETAFFQSTGADAPLGAGALPGVDSAGGHATGFGAGGGGVLNGVSSGDQAGGNGAPGTIIVWEYR